MAERLKITAVSGGRADWGLLSVPLAALRDDPAFDVRLIVTGQHLAAGETASLTAISVDGFTPDEHVNIGIGDDDSAAAIAQATGLAVDGIARAIARLSPDLMLLLGDRYEILAAATAALLMRVPVAHLCGGDITEGAMDDAIRHAITKLAHIHFVTNAQARDRVVQMGEDPARVHCVGSPGLDRIRLTPAMPRQALLDSVGLKPCKRLLLVTYHPVTLSDDPLEEAAEMLAALGDLGSDHGILFTGSNADPGARGIDGLIGAFVGERDNAVAVRSLGATRYFSALAHADAVVGNSSSGLYEAPSFAKPTVNIGDRQKGRLRAASVIDCAGDRESIRAAIGKAMSLDCSGVTNPYGDGHSSERIVSTLKSIGSPRALLRKRFHTLPVGLAA